jgi:plastocyanin
VRTALSLVLGALAAAPAGAAADVHVIRFGDALGDRYDPAELTVEAGDAVEWAGDFATHPLRYRPSPAEPFTDPYAGPSPLRRTLTAPGDRLEFVCAIHGDAGMRGVVTAAARSVTRPPLLRLRTEPAEPVAGRPVTFVAAYVEGTGDLRYTRFAWDLDGDGRVTETRGVDRVTSVPRVTTTYERPGRRRMSVTASSGAAGPAERTRTRTRLRFVVAASADDVPPVVRIVGLEPVALAALLRDGLSVTLRGSERARADVALLDGPRVLGRARRGIGPRDVTVRMRLSARSAASLRGRRDVRLKLRVVAHDDAGNRTTLRKTFIAR